MAKESNMLPLGTKAIPFKLIDVVSKSEINLIEFANNKPCLLMFICNHCPYVKHLNAGLVSIANDYLKKGVAIIAINSNDPEAYPDDSPEKMREVAANMNYPFPYLFDETQEVAKSYQAACTPDFYLFNKSHELVYRGQFDDSRPSNSIPVTGNSIREALDNLLAGKPINSEQTASLGCGIKWK